MSRSSISIDTAARDDMAAVVALEETVSQAHYPNAEFDITEADVTAFGFGETRVVKYQHRFFDNPKGRLWVAKTGEHIVGFIAATKSDSRHWLRKLYVLPEYQDRGVGEQLLQTALNWLGLDQDIVLGIASYDAQARDFYAQHGFEEAGSRAATETTLSNGKVLPETWLVLRAQS